jgi:hypothetical protein
LKKTSFALELIKNTSKHFYDPRIANPEMKETYMTRLNMIMQYSQYMKMLEQYEYTRSNLVPTLL